MESPTNDFLLSCLRYEYLKTGGQCLPAHKNISELLMNQTKRGGVKNSEEIPSKKGILRGSEKKKKSVKFAVDLNQYSQITDGVLPARRITVEDQDNVSCGFYEDKEVVDGIHINSVASFFKNIDGKPKLTRKMTRSDLIRCACLLIDRHFKFADDKCTMKHSFNDLKVTIDYKKVKFHLKSDTKT
uniref:SWIB domain-containing protein n=1 Tax=Caenorhabditis tropicalis TaxID=1561998 RepID=A0A1I7UV47_9PELO